MNRVEKQLAKVEKSINSYNKWARTLGYVEIELVVTDNGDGITQSFTNDKGQTINCYGNGYKLSDGYIPYKKNLIFMILGDIIMSKKWNRLYRRVSKLRFLDYDAKRAKHVYGNQDGND